jgi:hypothetical protein
MVINQYVSNVKANIFKYPKLKQELKSGPKKGTGLVTTAYGGNLFSLLGFDGDYKPIKELKEVLKNSIRLKINNVRIKKVNKGILFEIPVESPTLEAVGEQLTELEWTSRSWTSLIENGIPWFSHYLFKKEGIDKSRSGTAIEVKGTIEEGRDSTFSGIPYLSKLLKGFRDSLK